MMSGPSDTSAHVGALTVRDFTSQQAPALRIPTEDDCLILVSSCHFPAKLHALYVLTKETTEGKQRLSPENTKLASLTFSCERKTH